ncbi:MAG TPA: gliding motility-associated C-terminal domain-containing protein, partial [Bacteroidia bacterium]|nr:gliding motility-associated C-terminal domain-containing protein [Bacteroidia bacterium]
PCFGGMPSNNEGYQYARSGIAYAGLDAASQPSQSRDYITGVFSTALKNSKKYCITFYVSLADSVCYASGAMGAYLSNSTICDNSTIGILPYTPQIENPLNNILTDVINWVPISGEYNALGGEQYITLGNFYSDSLSDFRSAGDCGQQYVGNTYKLADYFVDDVSVREITFANAGRDTLICIGDKVLIGKDSSVVGVSYNWQPTAGLSTPNAAQTIASPTITTTYTLTVVNDSMKGCNCPDSINSDTVTIHVCPLENNIFIPDAFSPNGDGQNDVLFAKGNNVNTFYLAIYDRWGNKVFESESESVGWDGTYKGKPEETGTYAYYANGTYTDGTGFTKKGNITLVR